LSRELTDFERKVYNFIKRQGEMLTARIPTKMMGVIPMLRNKGLVEVFKKRTSEWSFKKRKFVRLKKGISQQEE
jgi:hypothetical protein